jgi:hypothetical protein
MNPNPEKKLDVCQIQIQPVDNGFVVQAINLDIAGRKTRQIATTIEDLRDKLVKIIETLYEPVPTPAPPTAKAEDKSGGPTGTKSTP